MSSIYANLYGKKAQEPQQRKDRSPERGAATKQDRERSRSPPPHAAASRSTAVAPFPGGEAPRLPLGIPSLGLLTFQRNLYYEHPAVTARTDEEIAAFRKEKQIEVYGSSVPKPVTTFEEASFPAYVLAELQKAGFPAPTPIQAQAWPMALTGRDVVGQAETGSGKTLAYLLPAVVHINAQPYLSPGDGPIALVLAPTRELALQIQAEAARFGGSSRIKTSAVYGGVPKQQQIKELRDGCEIVIATPGRLIDLIESRATSLKRVTYLVLDEADRMLDMGFEPQIRTIVGQIRVDRQTLLFSATWPEDVQAIAGEMLRNPLKVVIGGLGLKANINITQTVKVVAEGDKYKSLIRLLGKELGKAEAGPSPAPARIIVFAGTKAGVDELTRRLRTDGFPALGMHGDKDQLEREWVLGEFKSGKHPIMVATSVAARGLDVKDIRCVINYDMPNTIEDYVHRIGRTGRAGEKGRAYSLFTPASARMAGALAGLLRDAGQTVPSELNQMAAVAAGSAGGLLGPGSTGSGGAGGFSGAAAKPRTQH